MIKIRKSPTADTRSCDYTKVTKEKLLDSSIMHKDDVEKGIDFLAEFMRQQSFCHDNDKLSNIDQFHEDFLTGFKQTIWWDNHRKVNRHHLTSPDGVPEDVNLIDVLEHIVDCVMAGKARTGQVYTLKLDPKILEDAFQNTVELMIANVEVEE